MSTSQAQLLVSGEYVNVEPQDTTELFPENDCASLRAAVSVCVLARRQHSNSHHLLMRGQWLVRDRLIEMFGKRFFEKTSFF